MKTYKFINNIDNCEAVYFTDEYKGSAKPDIEFSLLNKYSLDELTPEILVALKDAMSKYEDKTGKHIFYLPKKGKVELCVEVDTMTILDDYVKRHGVNEKDYEHLILVKKEET